jgi:hypothetical protein
VSPATFSATSHNRGEDPRQGGSEAGKCKEAILVVEVKPLMLV